MEQEVFLSLYLPLSLPLFLISFIEFQALPAFFQLFKAFIVKLLEHFLVFRARVL